MKKYLATLLILISVSSLRLSAQVNCQFTPSVLFGCPPLVVNFTDQSTGGATSYEWYFGNSNSSTIQNVSATYPDPGIYNVIHIATNATSSDTAIMQIRVFQPPTVDFASDDNRGCIFPCHTVNFLNLSTPGESPIAETVWDFGDGTLPISAWETDHCYNQTGEFDVTLVARDTNGCQSNEVKLEFVLIGNNPVSNATASPVQSCNTPQLVTFTGSGTSSNGTPVYEWYFDNGSTSSSQNPNQVFVTGIYDPILVITDTLGCQDTAYTHVEVTNIIAGFTAPSQNACRGIPVQFTDISNFASTWSWSFGDGGISSLQHPLHSYTANGTYTVSLIVTYGICSDTVVQNLYINVTSPINFTMSADDISACSPPLTVNFTNNAVGASGYLWNFGDGDTSTSPNPSHTYTTTGTFTVTLGVSNAQGCVNTRTLTNNISVGALQANFTLDSVRGCSPMTVQFADLSTSNVPITTYEWHFDDGGTSPLQNPSHTYTTGGAYIPYLIIENAEGCRDTTFYGDTILVGQGLTADFVALPLVQCINQNVEFTNLTVGTTPATDYLWEFGDGQTSTDQSPIYQYSDTGTYDITLTVIHQGCPNRLIRTRYIVIVVPKADFDFDYDCSNPTTITFNDKSQGADTWKWRFGDGDSSNVPSPTHTFPVPGDYIVELEVFNATTGCIDILSKQISIGTPAAAFTADVIAGCEDLRVAFTDTSTFASSWLWDFGDSTATSSSQNPVHMYRDTGQYTVTLIINPNDSCSDMVVKTNYITVYGVKARITANPITGCVPLTVSFTDASVSYSGSVTSWVWNFTTGDSSFVPNTVYTFDTTADFNVSLYVTDSHGCLARDFQLIRVANLNAGFTCDTLACPGEGIRFTNLSNFPWANTFTWYFGDGATSTLRHPLHSYSSPGIYTVTLIAQNTATGCTDTAIKTNINVADPIPDFYPGSNFASCPPFPVQFYNTSNRQDLEWLWYFGDGDTSTTIEPLHVYKFPGDYDVTLVAWDSSGCADTITYIDLIRLRGPIGNFTATPDTGCVPLTISLTGSVASTVSIVADMGDGTGFSGIIDITHTYTAARTYYPSYTLADSLGCEVVYVVDTIVVGDYPRPALNDTTVCKGNYVQFNLTEGSYFNWTSDLTPSYLTCTDCADPLSMAPDTITYFVTATSDIGCAANDTVIMYVDALPIIFPGINFRICPGDTLQLDAGTNVSDVTWEPFLYMNDSTIVNPLVWPPDSMIYRVTARNVTGCTISRIVKVEEINKVVSDISLDTTLCEGGTIALDLDVYEASYNDTSFFWMPPAYLNSTSIEDPVFTAPPGDYNLTVIISSSTCTPDTGFVHIAIESIPKVEAGDDQTVAVGATVQLWASSPNSVSYQWIPTDSLSCTDCRRPYLTAYQNQTIPVIAVSQLGCRDTAFVNIRVVECDEKMVFVPNTFTPNDDNLNDKLFVRGIALSSLQYFRIFDRWGKLVFETKDASEGWDGTIQGKRADLATYVYLLKGNCSGGSEVLKSGNVTLVR